MAETEEDELLLNRAHASGKHAELEVVVGTLLSRAAELFKNRRDADAILVRDLADSFKDRLAELSAELRDLNKEMGV